MIKKTRIKIIVFTTAILLVVFVAIGAITYSLMLSQPPKVYFREFGQPPIEVDSNPELRDTIRIVENRLAKQWLSWYSLFAGAGLAALFGLTCLLSGWIVKPVKETIEKQRRFVSDASHELKTPVSIISANADALALSDADTKWLQNIRAQTERMRLLTNDLMMLTRLDEGQAESSERLNLSETVNETVLSFESVAFEAGRNLSVNIAADIYYNGVREHVVRAVNVLTDNAIKYSETGGTVCVTLSKQGARPLLAVHNTGGGIEESEKNDIFDRFYRSDDSRARQTGGYGLGLSILKGLASKNGWRLAVESDGKSYAAFLIYF